MNLNCWEYKRCGREPGGERVEELGICPTTVEWTMNGAHGGRNAGRVCWVVSGTFCDSLVVGTHAREINSCVHCDFFQKVQSEGEGLYASPFPGGRLRRTGYG
jgi:hypothetical protein